MSNKHEETNLSTICSVQQSKIALKDFLIFAPLCIKAKWKIKTIYSFCYFCTKIKVGSKNIYLSVGVFTDRNLMLRKSNNNMNKIITITLILILLGFIYYKFSTKKAPPIPIDKTKLEKQDGMFINLENYRGKVMIVSYFQTWCGDCIREQPELMQLQQTFSKEELQILMITDESWEKINAFKAKHNSTLDFYKSEKALKSIGIHRFPTTYLLDKNGQLVEAKVEGIDWYNETMVAEIKSLISAN